MREIDEQLAEAHTSLANVFILMDWNWSQGEMEFKRAIELNSNYATAYQWYSNALTSRGEFENGLPSCTRCRAKKTRLMPYWMRN